MPDVAGQVFKDEAVYLGRIADTLTPPIIKEAIFDNCQIIGPALVVTLKIPQWEGVITVHGPSIEAVYLEGSVDSPIPAAAIGLENCIFKDCEFIRVTFMGPRDVIDIYRSTFRFSKSGS